MPIKVRNNDQNISRVRTKMSEGCSSQKSKPKLTGIPTTEKLSNLRKYRNNDISNHSYNHLYASNSKSIKNSSNVNANSQESNGQNCKSEVRFLEEWLLLHLDLIQQQNEEIVSKERTIYMLQQENEMLREHINCLQQGIGYSQTAAINSYSCDSMTQDATHIKDEELVYDCQTQKAINDIRNCGSLNNILSYNDTIIDTRVQAPCDIDLKVSTNLNLSNNPDKTLCTLRETHNSGMKRNPNDFVVNNYQDTLNNFKMSIRRKRLCSGSSAFSNNTSIEEPNSTRKRKKCNIKGEITTSSEHYVTQANEMCLLAASDDLEHNGIPYASNLEVPRWRVRVYTSCYTMEGTENLDDEVYNKRHMRLESNEKRRKKWDVQRIREQRAIEKLKLRQERIAGAHSNAKDKIVSSLWPTVEDVRFIEVADELPVSAFGAPVPKFTPSDFSLPWLSNLEEVKLHVEEFESELPPHEIEIPVKKLRPDRKPRKRRKATKR